MLRVLFTIAVVWLGLAVLVVGLLALAKATVQMHARHGQRRQRPILSLTTYVVTPEAEGYWIVTRHVAFSYGDWTDSVISHYLTQEQALTYAKARAAVEHCRVEWYDEDGRRHSTGWGHH